MQLGPIIKLKPIIHRKQHRIVLEFAYNPTLNKMVKTIPKASWSKTLKAWHIPMVETSYKIFTEKVKYVAAIDNTLLKAFLKNRKIKEASKNLPTKLATAKTLPHISLTNAKLLAHTIEQLQLKAYSSSTIRTYKNEISIFLKVLKNTDAATLTPDRLRKYFLYCINDLGLKENTIHSRLNALKFMYEQVLGREKFFVDIPRPKKPTLLPKVLSEIEIGRLFRSLKNKKHKAMLFTAYSAGLRVSEIAALKLKHIDSGRMQIFIENAKGKKDRYVNLSPVLLDILRDYIKCYTPRPKEYLFESEHTCTAYPIRTVQEIFRIAREKSGINKSVGIHVLRHSFATHLLEKGTDIFYIKELLGHFNIKTTEIYLHVSKKKLVNIVSPLDDLHRKGIIDW